MEQPLSHPGSLCYVNTDTAGEPARPLTPPGRRIPRHGADSDYPTREHPFTCGTWDAPDPLVTTDGKTVVCGASSIFAKPAVNPAGGQCGGPAWSSGGIVEYSAATGKLIRTLYRSESNCLRVSAPVPVAPLWTSDSGDRVLGYFNYGDHIRFGVIRQGTFT